MILQKKAWRLKNSNMVVTARNMIKNTSKDDFEEVSFQIPFNTLRRWTEEIENAEEATHETRTT